MLVRCQNCHTSVDIPPTAEQDTSRCPTCGSALSVLDETAPLPAAAAQLVEHFRLLEKVGHGQFGDVWKAYDTQLDRIVAIKIPRLGPADRQTKAMFLREARAAAQLHHPHIVTVYEVGSFGDTIYIASEFIQGVTLKERLAHERLSRQAAVELCRVVANALQHAHEAGVFHRDLKPANILLDGAGQPHLADFGLARRESGEATQTGPGAKMGTPAYMSPEQARGDSHHADARSDVYSLGVILYELLTGQRPFSGKGRYLEHQTLYEEPPALRSVSREMPRDLETICLKALRKAPEQRYPTARELAEELHRYQAGRPILARPVTRLERSWRWVRRNRAVAIAGSVAVLASLLVPVAGWRSASPTAQRTVSLATDPQGAHVVFIPLDPKTGEPQPHAKQKAGRSPVRTRLAPGDYLVVAYLDQERFHEVYRHVPEAAERLPDSPFRARRWKESGGCVELPLIHIHSATLTQGMAHVPGGNVELGSATLQGLAPPHRRQVPDFFLETTEVSVAQVRKLLPKWPELIPPGVKQAEVPPNFPAAGISFDEALDVAESWGKRLPDEAEYEFAARAGGTQIFPWPDDAPPAAWPTGPVGAVPADRVVFPGQPPIVGLCSGVAEWTVSWPAPYPSYRRQGLPSPPDLWQWRVVRGGNESVLAGEELVDAAAFHPCARPSVRRSWSRPGLGFRCARSARPRLEPEDFVTDLP